MKLNAEQIKFIDKYLQKSDVIFVDVRAELIDHIASAVEEKMEAENVDFYDAFKSFMVVNKKELLKTKKYFIPSIISFAKTLYKPYNIFIGIFIIVACYYILQFPEPLKIFKIIYQLLFACAVIIALVNFIYTFLILRKRFIYLEKLSVSLSIVYYFNMIFNVFYSNFFGTMTSVVVASFLTIAYFIYWIQTMKSFKKKYAYL